MTDKVTEMNDTRFNNFLSDAAVLIGCEESQAVCKAFREIGIEAYSCDLLPCSGGHPEWHLQMDIEKAIKLRKWKIIGLHPVCTKLALSGNRHYAPNKPRHPERLESIEWTINLWKKSYEQAEMIYMENPLGAMNTDSRLPKPQIIHPFYFGDAVSKKTCLWLKNLPPLQYAITETLFQQKTAVQPDYVIYKSHKSKSGFSRYSIHGTKPSTRNEANRKFRSKTFPGIAKAMAEQWGKLLLPVTASRARARKNY